MAASNAEIQRLSAKRDCDRHRRRRSAETDKQTAARRPVERSRSQRRRQAQKSTDSFEAALIDIDNVACIGGLSSVYIVAGHCL